MPCRRSILCLPVLVTAMAPNDGQTMSISSVTPRTRSARGDENLSEMRVTPHFRWQYFKQNRSARCNLQMPPHFMHGMSIEPQPE